MNQHLIFLLLGLANGAVFGALALTLVVTYRSSGVVNFATGAMSLLGAYFYALLRKGQLLLPLPGLPTTVDIGGDPGFVPAVLAALAVCAVTGLLLYLVVFRPLRTAPAVAKAVASLGVLVVFTGLFTERLGDQTVTVMPILPTRSWTLGSVLVSSDRVWFATSILALAVGLAAAYRFTRFGLLTRAVAETEKGAFVSGISPERIAAANWMVSAVIAGISGILIAPIVPLTPAAYTLFIVPALAAAVLGQFTAMIPAVLGGLAIGMVQSESVYLRGQHPWMPSSGLAELVPLVLLLVVFLLWAKPLPSRGAVTLRSLGRAPRPRPGSLPLTALVWTAVGVVAVTVSQGQWRDALVTSFIFSIIGLSLVVVTGYAGQVSLAQLTLAGVAGFILGPMTESWHIPFPLAPLLAALTAAVVGVVVGLPALRIRGLPVAVVTLAMGVAIEAVWFRNPDYAGTSGRDIAGPRLFGLDLRARIGADYPRLPFSLMVLFVLVVVALAVARLRTSALGSRMLAVRANERSAAGAGIDVIRVKLIAFASAAFIAGLGGAMIGYKQANVTFDAFSAIAGLALFGSVYLAGITSVSGGIVAGVIAGGGITAYVIGKALDSVGDPSSIAGYYGIVSGLLLIYTVITNPEGIVGPVNDRLARRRAARAAPGAPAGATAGSVPEAAPLAALPPAPGGDVLLAARGVHVRYGGVVAVDGVDLEVREGTIVGLIGPNGAGKTTLLDALSGFAPCTGTVTVAGREVTGLPPHRRVRASLGRTFQHVELYEDLTVNENVVVGRAAATGRQPRGLHDTLELLGLEQDADRPVSELSQGRRQLVSIARALIGNPAVLLLDEPAGGLDSTESQWLGHRLRTIRDSGVAILIIDHDMHLVLNLCDDIYVLDFGHVIAHGPPAQVRADRAVAAAYLGTTHAEESVA